MIVAEEPYKPGLFLQAVIAPVVHVCSSIGPVEELQVAAAYGCCPPESQGQQGPNGMNGMNQLSSSKALRTSAGDNHARAPGWGYGRRSETQ